MNDHYLHSLFEPTSIAVFGASESLPSVGATVYKNLIEMPFKGQLFPINSKHDTIFGQPCFHSIEGLEEPIDLAVITTPASTVLHIVEACGKQGVKAALILSAGFREIGEQGQQLEAKVVNMAKRYGIRFIGPNCLGVMRPSIGYNATFNRGATQAGNLALVSQSGALSTSILDWANTRGIGFSSVISMGASADVGFGEVLDYLTYDGQTKSILLYIEGIQNARSFMSGLRAASRVKPVLAVKVGRHASGSQAAKSHTGALVGSDDVFDAALRRAGGVRGYRVNDLFVAATVLSKSYHLTGENLVIITNGGGPAVMAADYASDLNIQLAPLSDTVKASLNDVLPATWSRDNPIDIIGDATPERYENTLSVCLGADDIHGMIVILSPQAMADALAVAESVTTVASQSTKVVLTCWMGGEQIAAGRGYLETNNVPTFQTPEAAVEAFSYLRNFYVNQKLLLQAPSPLAIEKVADVQGAQLIIENVLAEERTTLTELESMAVLSAFHIPTTRATLAKNASEALVHAESMGYPVAMKIYSKDISHKSDVDGVRLGISNAAAVQTTYRDIVDQVKNQRPEAIIEGVTVEKMYTTKAGRKLLVGLFTDPVFGPVITFGAGGTAVEILRDRDVSLPPLNRTLVKELIGRTKVAKMLGPFRQLPAANVDAIEDILLRVSEMACQLPWIKELDINPLIVDDQLAMAVDARIIVDHYSGTVRYDHMAIHPYPHHLVSQEQLRFGVDVTIRPIRPEDAPLEMTFVKNLSFQSKYFRFMHGVRELTPKMLARFTQIDYDVEMALIAISSENGTDTQVGVARYVTNVDRTSCEFAVVVADAWQEQGIAFRLMKALIQCAREKGLQSMEGFVLAENTTMLAFCRRMGFDLEDDPEDRGVVNVRKYLHE